MEFLKHLLPLGAGFLTIALLEFVWLMKIMTGYIIGAFGNLVLSRDGNLVANVLPGFLAWFTIVLLWYIFVIKSGYASSLQTAFGYGALIGALSYAMYDLTNLAFIKNYPEIFAYIDTLWGAVLGAAVCTVMYLVEKNI